MSGYKLPIVRLREELASALEDLDREVRVGNDLMRENAKYREALEMAYTALVEHGDAYHGHFDRYHEAIAKINEVLNK